MLIIKVTKMKNIIYDKDAYSDPALNNINYIEKVY